MSNWDVEFMDEFELCWEQFTEVEQESIAASVGLLEESVPDLRHPHSSGGNNIQTRTHEGVRTQHEGRHTERSTPTPEEPRSF